MFLPRDVARNYTSFSLDPTLKRSEMTEHLRRDDDNPSEDLRVSRFMGSRSHPHRVLSVCVCVCVSRCLWVCVIEADSLQLRVITVGLYQFLSRSLSCQILAVFAVDVYGPFWFLVPRFLSPAFLDSNS